MNLRIIVFVERAEAIVHDDGIEEVIEHSVNLFHRVMIVDVNITNCSVWPSSDIGCEIPINRIDYLFQKKDLVS